MKLRAFLAASAVLALAGAGCGSSSGSSNQPNGMIPANTPGGTTPETSNRQLITNGDATLPDGFPTDIPRYQPSVIISATADQRHAVEALSSQDEAGLILSWYNTAFTSAGYASAGSAVTGNITSKAYQKDQVKFIINVTDQADQNPKTLFSIDRIDLSVQ